MRQDIESFAAAAAAKRPEFDDPWWGRVARAVGAALESRWLPAACGAWAFSLVWLLWGSLRQVSVGNDETSYLLQARIFATGHLVGAGRPLPEFFQQFHVFVEPVLASKYPPGHALLLTLGVWLGLPGLVPALLVAVTAALLCSLTRRFSSGGTALLAVLLSTTSDIALRFNPSYFSETTTSALFLVGWWGILEYWERRQSRWLILCAVAVGWGGITRPLTMLAFAVPAGATVLVAMHRHRRWRDVVPGLGVIIAILAFQGAWNERVVGDWKKMPHAEYARLYTPSDRLGFHATPAPPAAAGKLSPDEQLADRTMRRVQDGYTPAKVPPVATLRAASIIRGTWSYGGLPGLAVLFAAAVLPIAVFRVVVGTILCVFGAYLLWPMDSTWTLYYLELEPPLAFLTAVGIYGGLRWLARELGERRWRGAIGPQMLRAALLAGAAAVLMLPVVGRVASYRRAHAAHRRYRAEFQRALEALPPVPSIVFVRYAPGHGEERLVDNVPDLQSARTWVVHDLGAENARLVAFAPNRVAYSYQEHAVAGRFQFTIARMLPGSRMPGAESGKLPQP